MFPKHSENGLIEKYSFQSVTIGKWLINEHNVETKRQKYEKKPSLINRFSRFLRLISVDVEYSYSYTVFFIPSTETRSGQL